MSPVWRQETERMSGRTIIGVALLILGIIALAYQGFTYTVPKKAVDLGPIQVTRQERHTVPLPPILGALALIGGIAVLVLDRSSK
jgi:drug/metabolite transporter (DMT)-like permease